MKKEDMFDRVGLLEASKRLEKIVNSGLSKAELRAFQDVAHHRNKMVHFFHESTTDEDKERNTRIIVKEQLKAWYFLHQLLTSKWKKEFSSWSEKIKELKTILKKYHEFLQVTFDELQPKIKQLKKDGYFFCECSSCGFESQQLPNLRDTVYYSRCLVYRM